MLKDRSSIPWPRQAASFCALLGLLIAVYLSAAHASAIVPLYCTQGGVVNCERVTSSPSSAVAGVPVAYFGVVWFAAMAVVLRLFAGGRLVARLRLAWSAAGVLAVFYLIYAELYLIGALCLWCSVVHVLVLVIFALITLFPEE